MMEKKEVRENKRAIHLCCALVILLLSFPCLQTSTLEIKSPSVVFKFIFPSMS